MVPTLLTNSDFNIDAHSILTDLDKSLRSTLIGDQCEAIVRFPWLFQRYPFPILVNSAALKLAEVFRNGTNFLRILILQVMKESEKHLDKILNVDEFVRLLFGVSYSNDPLARSITLRTLGHIARIASENKSIYHFIRNSLDSNDELEVEAAIEASVRYAIESKDFGEIIYPKIISMIEGLTTSMKTKIRLLEVINNLHHNFIIAEDAREKLIGFLAKYPGKRFVSENLHTLTSISASSVTKISDQVKLLLEYYQTDPRSSIKFSVLKDLGLLAYESAHLWEKNSIIEFVKIVLPNFNQENTFFAQTILDSNSKDLRLLCEALGVLSKLLSSPSIFINDSLFSVSDISTIINFCTQIIHQAASHSTSNKSDKEQILLVSKCFTILTNICLYINPEFYQKIIDDNVMSKTSCAYEAYFFSKFTTNMNGKESKKALQMIFRSAVILCRAKEAHSRQITEALRFIFLNSKPKCSWYEIICDSICSLASIIRDNKSLTAADILDVMKSRYGQLKNKTFQENESAAIKIFIIYFQLKNGQTISQSEKNCLLEILNESNLWICYKIVREAMRFGHHSFASLLLFKFKNCMEPIENTYFWINSLERITKAESCLSEVDFCSFKGDEFLTVKYEDSKFEQSLSMAISTYTQGFTHLKASVSSSNPMKFKCGFIKLRMKYLQAHQHFRRCCKLLQSSPPPISTIGSASTDDFLKCGRIGFSMRKCASEFRSIADGYSSLYQSSFNADPNSLSNIQLLQHSCTILAEVIENLFESSHRKHSLFVPSRSDMSDNIPDLNSSSTYSEYNNMNIISNKHYTIVEHKELEDICTLISELVRTDQLLSLSNINAKQSSDNNHFLTVFTNQIDMLIRISTRILSVPLSFPRFYFQKIQFISIKLELSPQPKNNQEYILVNQSSQFVLNVEGVVNSNSDLQRPSQSHNLNSLRFGGGYSASSLPSLSDSSLSHNASNESRVIRRVNKILLNLNVVQTSTNSPNDINSNLNSASIISMHSVVTPLNDYFQTQFLLTFTNVGIYNITVETSIIDENDAQWKTGPIQSTIAKVIEDYKPL